MRKSRGFTLVELLIVVAILAMLVGILLPTLSRAKEIARDVVCKGNLKSMWTPMRFFAEDHDGFLPTAADEFSRTWNQKLANYGKDQYGWTPPRSYTAQKNFECPSYEYKVISRRGCYGMNWAMANYHEEADFTRGRWPHVEYMLEATLRPREMYLVGDTSRWAPHGGHHYAFLRLPGHCTPKFRHLGAHPDGHCNVLFHDTHVEPLVDKELQGQGPWQRSLPWWNAEDYGW